jgi:hypothetical protein
LSPLSGDSVNSTAAREISEELEGFEKKAKEWTEKFAVDPE